RLLVGDGHIFSALAVLEPCMLRADAGVVQSRRDGMRLGDLPVRVLQEVRPVAVKHTWLSGAKRRRVLAGVEPLAGCLDADQPRLLVGAVGVENPHRVGTAARESGT